MVLNFTPYLNKALKFMMITFILGERILCFHGPLIYDAKCLKVRKTNGIDEYLIHYAGWNKALVVYVVTHKEKVSVFH